MPPLQMPKRKVFPPLSFCTLFCMITKHQVVRLPISLHILQSRLQRVFDDLVYGLHLVVRLRMVGVENNLVIFHFRKNASILRPSNYYGHYGLWQAGPTNDISPNKSDDMVLVDGCQGLNFHPCSEVVDGV